MWEMADGSCNLVMKLVVQNNRKGLQAFHEFFISLYFFFGYLRSRSKNIVCIFNQHSFGITVTAFLGSGHRMSPDEILPNTEILHFFVDVRLYTSDICEDAVIIQIFRQLFQIGGIICDRCA